MTAIESCFKKIWFSSNLKTGNACSEKPFFASKGERFIKDSKLLALSFIVVLISGFSEEYTEFEDNCVRIINKKVCHGCWNSVGFDRGDWMTCPRLKDTYKQFECTSSITPEHVIERILESNEN